MTASDPSDHAMLSEAVEAHLWDLAESLLEGRDVNHVFDGFTLLSQATRARDLAAVRWLMERGADPNRYNDNMTTALGCARDAETVRMLVEAGASVEYEQLAIDEFWYRGEPDTTSVHRAAESGDLVRLRLLLEGAHGRSAFGCGDYLDRTPLACAAYNGHAEALDLLLACGAHPDGLPADDYGIPYTALQRAMQNRHFDCAERLLDAGADPNLSNGLNTPAYEEARRVDCPPALLARLERALARRRQDGPGVLRSI